MHWSSAIPVALAALSAIMMARRQCVLKLGSYGCVLAPPLALIVWFILIDLGQHSGSLVVMAWTAAAPLIAIAIIAVARFKSCGIRSLRWTYLDLFIVACAGLLIVAYNGNDNLCHYAIVNTYLRGNVPPCSLNDPATPLVYHTLFDAAAALCAHAFGLIPESALDAVTFACLLASYSALQAVSRMLFANRWTHQIARLLFVAGFGPSYLVAACNMSTDGWESAYQGRTTRPFIESIFRRPMGLNFVLFLAILAIALPRLFSQYGRAHSRHSLSLAWLVPIAFLVPHVSEELVAFLALLVVALWLSGAVSMARSVCLGGITIVSMVLSPVIRAVFLGHNAAAAPELAWGWPPTLPSWDPAYYMDGIPLFTSEAVWRCILEWGPLFAAGMVLGAKDPRRRVLVATFLAGFAVACSARLHRWIKSDLDRFLFYGTSAGFMLIAAWIERLELWYRSPNALATAQRIKLRSACRIVGVAFLVIPTILGPAAYAVIQISTAFKTGFERPQVALPEGLKELLSVVGPRDLVLADQSQVQNLVLSGFVVAAPLASNPTGSVMFDQFPSYFEANPQLDPKWFLLPANDARLLGHRKMGEYNGLVLAAK